MSYKKHVFFVLEDIDVLIFGCASIIGPKKTWSEYSHIIFHNVQLQQKMGEFKPLSKKIALQSHPMSKIEPYLFSTAITAVEHLY